MKKTLFALLLVAGVSTLATAQNQTTTVTEDKKVTKRTSTAPQKVHNTFSKKKHYSGKKTTHTTVTEEKNTMSK